jgi:hypothetical protein
VPLVALLASAVGVIGFGVAVVYPHRAAAEDNFATISPMVGIQPLYPDAPDFDVAVQSTVLPAKVTIAVNDGPANVYTSTSSGAGPYHYRVPAHWFDCRNDNAVHVEADYDGAPTQTQTIGGVQLKCPNFELEPMHVVGAGRTTITLPGWEDINGFDSDGAYTDPARAKRLYLDGTENDGTPLGSFGYQVTPTATVNLSCGPHVIELDQDLPNRADGELRIDVTLTVSCSSWTATPQGSISHRSPDPTMITVTDKTTVYPPGTTATAKIEGPNITLGPMTADQSGHLSGTFSDQGYFNCGTADENSYHLADSISIDITEPSTGTGTPIHLRQAAAATQNALVPLAKLCPAVKLSQHEVYQSAQPIKQQVGLWEFDNDDEDPYNAGRLQPKSVFLNGTRIATVSQPNVSHYVAQDAALTPQDSVQIPMTGHCGVNTVMVTQPTSFGVATAQDTFTVLCPTWSVTPQGVISKKTPSDLAIADKTTVYPAGTTATASFLGTHILGTMTADQSGHLSGTFSDKGYLQCGNTFSSTDSVRIEIVEPDPATATQTVEVPVVSLCPAVNLSHDEVDQSALPLTQQVGFWQFDDDDDPYDGGRLGPKSVFLNGARVATVSEPSVADDNDSAPVAMSGRCGMNTVVVTQSTSFGVATAQNTFIVLCPQISVSPAVAASTALPQTISLHGTAFHATAHNFTQPYTVSLDGKRVAQGDADQNGVLTNSFTAPSGLVCGVHTVTVTEQPRQGGEDTATPAAAPAPADPDGPMTSSTPLVVNCPQSRQVTTVPPGGGSIRPVPTLAVNPVGVITGMRTLVTGTGFRAGRRVTLTWKLSDGHTEAACPGSAAITLPDGTFTVYCLVRQLSRLGHRQLIGKDGSGSATADALIISSTMQPSNGHNRLITRR